MEHFECRESEGIWSNRNAGNSTYHWRYNYSKTEYEALDTKLLLIVTEWTDFRLPDFLSRIKKLLKTCFFDGRNIYDPKDRNDLGIEH
jgi:UDPglucose 6-dehydrogenase